MMTLKIVFHFSTQTSLSGNKGPIYLPLGCLALKVSIWNDDNWSFLFSHQLCLAKKDLRYLNTRWEIDMIEKEPVKYFSLSFTKKERKMNRLRKIKICLRLCKLSILVQSNALKWTEAKEKKQKDLSISVDKIRQNIGKEIQL